MQNPKYITRANGNYTNYWAGVGSGILLDMLTAGAGIVGSNLALAGGNIGAALYGSLHVAGGLLAMAMSPLGFGIALAAFGIMAAGIYRHARHQPTQYRYSEPLNYKEGDRYNAFSDGLAASSLVHYVFGAFKGRIAPPVLRKNIRSVASL